MDEIIRLSEATAADHHSERPTGHEQREDRGAHEDHDDRQEAEEHQEPVEREAPESRGDPGREEHPARDPLPHAEIPAGVPAEIPDPDGHRGRRNGLPAAADGAASHGTDRLAPLRTSVPAPMSAPADEHTSASATAPLSASASASVVQAATPLAAPATPYGTDPAPGVAALVRLAVLC
ncbi:MAG: hypothetical protein QOF98_1127, partial [Streptomyces sp.]|nr:hypothetical protein [Streptomyces sp.]